MLWPARTSLKPWNPDLIDQAVQATRETQQLGAGVRTAFQMLTWAPLRPRPTGVVGALWNAGHSKLLRADSSADVIDLSRT